MSDQQRLCDYCQQYQVWIWNGTKLRDGSKVYVDENEARWSGKRCPSCERKRVRAALKCTPFERELIFAELRKQGFDILSTKFPLKVTKEGKAYSVGFRYATTAASRILLEEDGLQNSTDLCMLIFASTRLVTKDNVDRLQTSFAPELGSTLNHQMMVSRAGSDLSG